MSSTTKKMNFIALRSCLLLAIIGLWITPVSVAASSASSTGETTTPKKVCSPPPLSISSEGFDNVDELSALKRDPKWTGSNYDRASFESSDEESEDEPVYFEADPELWKDSCYNFVSLEQSPCKPRSFWQTILSYMVDKWRRL